MAIQPANNSASVTENRPAFSNKAEAAFVNGTFSKITALWEKAIANRASGQLEITLATDLVNHHALEYSKRKRAYQEKRVKEGRSRTSLTNETMLKKIIERTTELLKNNNSIFSKLPATAPINDFIEKYAVEAMKGYYVLKEERKKSREAKRAADLIKLGFGSFLVNKQSVHPPDSEAEKFKVPSPVAVHTSGAAKLAKASDIGHRGTSNTRRSFVLASTTFAGPLSFKGRTTEKFAPPGAADEPLIVKHKLLPVTATEVPHPKKFVMPPACPVCFHSTSHASYCKTVEAKIVDEVFKTITSEWVALAFANIDPHPFSGVNPPRKDFSKLATDWIRKRVAFYRTYRATVYYVDSGAQGLYRHIIQLVTEQLNNFNATFQPKILQERVSINDFIEEFVVPVANQYLDLCASRPLKTEAQVKEEMAGAKRKAEPIAAGAAPKRAEKTAPAKAIVEQDPAKKK